MTLERAKVVDVLSPRMDQQSKGGPRSFWDVVTAKEAKDSVSQIP